MAPLQNNEHIDIVTATRDWVERVVLGLNLCPFARPVLRKGGLFIEVCDIASPAACLEQLALEMRKLELASDDHTTLLVLARGFEQFERYLDLLDLAEALLQDLGYDGELQIASFHPEYMFDGCEPDDQANYTNRSPWPMLHLLRESAITEALQKYPDAQQVPERNIALMRSLDPAQIKGLPGRRD